MQTVFKIMAFMGTQYQTMYIKAESAGEAIRYAVAKLGAVSAESVCEVGQHAPYDVVVNWG